MAYAPAVSVMPQALSSCALTKSRLTWSSKDSGPMSMIVRKAPSAAGSNAGLVSSDCMIAGNHGHAEVTPSRAINSRARPASKCASAR
jgi:hypothetical protein